MKYKLHKEHGYNYIIEHGLNEVLLNEDHMSESPEEGLKGNNKIFEIILKGFVEKYSIINQVTGVMNRLLERSDPRISKKLSKNGQKKGCIECGLMDHTIRSHTRKYSLPRGNFDSEFNEIIL